MNALRALRRFTRAPDAPTAAAPGERCRICGAAVADEHAHLCDLEQRTLLCACAGCARLLGEPSTSSARYRVVPRRVRCDPGFALADDDWLALQIPVRLAFVFNNSRLGRWVALYPSPAGATESEVPQEAFAVVASQTPLAAALEPDVEALLVYGRRARPLETFLVPIDTCYRLVGGVRTHWRGFHGGDIAWRAIEDFFVDVRARARPLDAEERR
jgi:hypothetical protein